MSIFDKITNLWANVKDKVSSGGDRAEQLFMVLIIAAVLSLLAALITHWVWFVKLLISDDVHDYILWF